MPVHAGTAYVDVLPEMKDFGRRLRSDLTKEIQIAGTESGKKFGSSLTSSMKGAMAGVGAAFAAAGVSDFIGDAVRGASDLAESVSKSNQVFGQSAAVISSWADGAASKIGLSKQAAFDAAGTFGNMFAQLGIGSDRAAALSIEMVNLAADFASFHNADISDVIAAQSSAFRGEYDALQRFLPTITAATVEQRALQMTGKASTKELTAQEKALAVNKLMMEGAGDATGDFTRTIDGLANQQRVLSAEWTNAKTELGEGLLPVMTSLAQFTNDELVPAFKTLFTSGGEGTGWAATIRDVMSDVLGFVVGTLQQTMRLMANVIGAIPGGWGEDQADELRAAADGANFFRDELHASKAEILAAEGASNKLAEATKGVAAADATFTKSLTATNKATRDAATARRTLVDAQDDLAKLLKEGAVDEEKVADARTSLAEATRSLADANRGVAKAQRDYDKAVASAAALGGLDSAMDLVADAGENLADAQDSQASASERARDAAKELREAQAGDPEYQDKLADARDRLADAQDKVVTAEQKTIELAGPLVAATDLKTEAQRLLNEQLGTTKTALIDINALGPGGLLQQGMPDPLAEGILGAPPPLPVATTSTALPSNLIGIPNVSIPRTAPAGNQTTNNIVVNVTEPVRDLGLIGKAIAWQLP